MGFLREDFQSPVDTERSTYFGKFGRSNVLRDVPETQLGHFGKPVDFLNTTGRDDAIVAARAAIDRTLGASARPESYERATANRRGVADLFDVLEK
jgi:hypothetical protein